MLEVKGIIGEPASGKSTFIREKMKTLSPGTLCKEGLVSFHLFEEDETIIMGIYDEKLFSGTDRLAKNVGPQFREWISEKARNPLYENYLVLWEGERFTNNPTIQHLFNDEQVDFTLLLKEVPQKILEERRKARGDDNQNEKWQKGMKTRIQNLCKKFPYEVV